MIHIATVHHLSDKWIDIQLKYISEYIKTPYRVYAFLNGIKKNHSHKFYYSSKEDIKEHSKKLNILSEIILKEAEEDDLIMFLDGDAFPINSIDLYLKSKITKYNLLAIKRIDDFGDCQPHPSFCISKVDFWKSINGNWSEGYTWYNKIYNKDITDVGADLLKTIIENKIDWYPLTRSNNINIHPRWYGVYDNLIYHNGAGFRIPMSNVDSFEIENSFSKLEKLIDKVRFVRRILYFRIIKKNRNLGDTVFNNILSDFDFYKKL